MMHTKSCTKSTVVWLSQRQMLGWRLFRSWNGWFFFVKDEKNAIWGNVDSCTNRNGACAHYVMVSKFQWKPFWLATQRDPCTEWLDINRLCVIRIRKVCESMRLDSGPEVFVRVNRNYSGGQKFCITPLFPEKISFSFLYVLTENCNFTNFRCVKISVTSDHRAFGVV